jgi:hypothetical protein
VENITSKCICNNNTCNIGKFCDINKVDSCRMAKKTKFYDYPDNNTLMNINIDITDDNKKFFRRMANERSLC